MDLDKERLRILIDAIGTCDGRNRSEFTTTDLDNNSKSSQRNLSLHHNQSVSEQLVEEYDQGDHGNGQEKKPFLFDKSIHFLEQRFHGYLRVQFDLIVQIMYPIQ